MNKFVFIISTKECPDQVQDNPWNKVDPKKGISIDKAKLSEDCTLNYVYDKDKQLVIPSWQSIPLPDLIPEIERKEFRVYVVPCLKEDTKAEIRFQYLENVVNKVVENESAKEGIDIIYLIAHDKDFGVKQDDVFACESQMTGIEDYPKLKELISVHHVYLFQHAPEGKIYKYICNIPNTEDPKFGYDSCDKILDIIGKKSWMIKWFDEINSNKKNQKF